MWTIRLSRYRQNHSPSVFRLQFEFVKRSFLKLTLKHNSKPIFAFCCVTNTLLYTLLLPLIMCVSISTKKLLECWCYYHQHLVPVELLVIITTYLYLPLNDDTIRDAVRLWCLAGTPEDMQQCLVLYGHISYWDTVNVTDMNRLFYGAPCEKVNFNDDIGNWDVSNVTNMAYMFHTVSKFNQPLDKWNVSNVTTMAGMFLHANSFNQALVDWNVSRVQTMTWMILDHSWTMDQFWTAKKVALSPQNPSFSA